MNGICDNCGQPNTIMDNCHCPKGNVYQAAPVDKGVIYPCPHCGSLVHTGEPHECSKIDSGSGIPIDRTQIITPIDQSPKCPYCGKKHSTLNLCKEHPISKQIKKGHNWTPPGRSS